VCCLNSYGQFPGNRVQKHCQERYQNGGGDVALVIAKDSGVGDDLDGCSNATAFIVYRPTTMDS